MADGRLRPALGGRRRWGTGLDRGRDRIAAIVLRRGRRRTALGQRHACDTLRNQRRELFDRLRLRDVLGWSSEEVRNALEVSEAVARMTSC